MKAFTFTRTSVAMLVVLCLFGLASTSSTAFMGPAGPFQATDPGVRGGAPGAGGLFSGLSPNAQAVVLLGQTEFNTTQSVTDQPGHELGLGPRFNGTSCGGCHSQPAIGGSSPAVNPQIAMGSDFGATNTIPFLLTPDGPIREARFKRQPDGSPDGGVHALFTITGRSDAPGCFLQQPDFVEAAAHHNLSFRIPTPVFGAGLIEAIPDKTIVAGIAGKGFGISGKANRNGNDGTVTRFGWKAQNKSLDTFSAEAYNVEMGVTTDVFPQERDETEACLFNPTPENIAVIDEPLTINAIGDQVRFAKFMQHLLPPTPAPDTPSSLAGKALFTQIGCAACHTPTLRTGNAEKPYLANKDVNLFSDLLLHNMGPQLVDDISQGLAQGDEFRTAPLWGAGQRVFFLHDGRTSDLREAIEEHAGPRWKPLKRKEYRGEGQGFYRPSEATQVIQSFRQLSEIDKQHLLNFLRSL